jgi:hypothetical protein
MNSSLTKDRSEEQRFNIHVRLLGGNFDLQAGGHRRRQKGAAAVRDPARADHGFDGGLCFLLQALFAMLQSEKEKFLLLIQIHHTETEKCQKRKKLRKQSLSAASVMRSENRPMKTPYFGNRPITVTQQYFTAENNQKRTKCAAITAFYEGKIGF